jgi:preprotein translocase SecE subunit
MMMGVQVQQISSEEKVSKTSYLRELKEELKKVKWTTKEELILLTKIVVGSTFVLGFGIYAVDLTIKGVLTGFAALLHLILG